MGCAFPERSSTLRTKSPLDPYHYLDNGWHRVAVMPHNCGRNFKIKDLSRLQGGQPMAGTSTREARVHAFPAGEEAARSDG
jgi:hypothetical protein